MNILIDSGIQSEHIIIHEHKVKTLLTHEHKVNIISVIHEHILVHPNGLYSRRL